MRDPDRQTRIYMATGAQLDRFMSLFGLVVLVLLVLVAAGVYRLGIRLYNRAYITGRTHAMSEAVLCHGAVIPGAQIQLDYPCGE